MDAVAEIKERLNIEDVISQYVQLKRTGRNFKGLSPWTNERTPSFIVSPEKQIWHDFSSGKGGDMFSFVMEMEGLDFKGALDLLARQAGVELEQFKTKAADGRSHLKKKALEALELSAKFYQKQLTANNAALKYLIKDRGFNKQTLLKWQLGYAPHTTHALTDFLTKHGFTTDETKAAGVTIARSSHMSDMFRGRIMIPLANSQGQIIGFTARILDESDASAPKYINTPQSIVYDKSRHVFGLHHAKEAIRKEGFSVVAEGNLDVISSHQAGAANVVATAGTAITGSHLRELKRFSGDIRLCFDADSAGLSATDRAITLAQQVGVDLSIVNLGDSKDSEELIKDPDDLIRSDPKKWQKAISKADYAIDWLMERYQSQLDLKTAPGKRSFTDALLAVIRQLNDPVEQEHYLKAVAKITDSSFEAIQSKFLRIPGSEFKPLRKTKAAAGSTDAEAMEYQRLQDHLLAMALMQPKARGIIGDLKAEFFTEDHRRQLFNFLKANPEFKGEPNLAKGLQEISDYVKIAALQFEELYASLPLDDLTEQMTQLKRRLIDRYVKIQNKKLAASMQLTNDQKELNKLMAQANKLNELLNETPSEGAI